ncbi:MAG: hypothetical protein AAFQ62_05385 [Pseudomonadota bacterium]
MTEASIDELLEMAQRRRLSKAQLDRAAERLTAAAGSNSGDLYEILTVIGLAGDEQYERYVAPLVEYRQDPMIAALALKVLCEYWGLARKYDQELQGFIKGVPWDSDNTVRLAALSIAGEQLRAARNDGLLLLVTRAYGRIQNDPFVRAGAYFALSRAAGLAWADLPSATKPLSIDHEPSKTVSMFLQENGLPVQRRDQGDST